MEFRARNYEEERETHALPRTRADNHPLFSPAISYLQSDVVDNQVEEFLDPLREPTANVADPLLDLQHAGHPSTKMLEATTPQQSSTREWISFKRFLMQRFPVSKTVSVSSISDQVLRSSKGLEKFSTIANPDELEDPHKSYEEGTKFIARQEYISRLKELKEKIAQSWRSDDRVTTLKLGIKVAKLLTDTSVGQFYPTLFVLATDIMDMLGDLVWERIKQKAEFSDDGSVILCFLPENFQEKDVCSDAKETCYNWFSKIASVRELLPRIYLELALLPCWRFLTDQPVESLHRLVRMTRGLADPLTSSYCRLYIAHCAEKLPSFNLGCLITNINDIKFMLINATLPKEGSSKNFTDGRSLLVSLIEPCIEHIMHKIFVDASKRSVDNILAELGLGNKEIQGNTPLVSLILHHLIKEFPADSVNDKAMDIANLIDRCNDYTLDQCLNYRLLGFRLSESKPSEHIMDVVNRVIQVVSKRDKLDEYLKVIDAFMDLVLQYRMDNCLVNLLEGISIRTYEKGIAEAELACLQSILVKILLYFKNLEDVFALNHFLEILDMMYGRPQAIVSMQILEKAVGAGLICDPSNIQLLFKVSQALHDSVDYTNARDDDHQLPSRLISQFVNKVDYGVQMDQHLAFLIECREAFGSSNELKEALVHASNSLAMKASKNALKDINYMKSCIAFSEVTIPSITVLVKQFNLYIETIEIALLGGLLSHVNALVDSVIDCFESSDFFDGSRGNAGLDDILSSLQKLCSLLVMIPGDPERGLTDTPRNLLMSLDSKAWMTPRAKSRILCTFLMLSATLSQKCLPYHASQYGIPGNDILFYGDETYTKELIVFAEEVINKLVDTIKQEQSHVVRGPMALEARDCIRTCFKVTEDVPETCRELLQMTENGSEDATPTASYIVA